MHDVRTGPIIKTALAIVLTIVVVVVAVLALMHFKGVPFGGARLKSDYELPLTSPGLSSAPQASLDQRLGSHPTLDVASVDETGRHENLAHYFDGTHPVLLVPGYYRCPQLCGLVMHGLLDTLRQSGVPSSAWRVVGFSIDANDTAADALKRRAVFEAPASLHLLVLSPGDAKQLANQVGYSYEPVRGGTYAHPASVVLLTPNGTVSRYFNGIAFDPREMRVALADASGDRIGGVTSRLALLCAHFDPHMGKYTGTVMNAIRAVSFLLVAALAGWAWRRL